MFFYNLLKVTVIGMLATFFAVCCIFAWSMSQPTNAEIARAKDHAICIKNDPRYDAEINAAFPCER